MEIEHIARISFAAGRALEHERNLAIGHGVLGKIVKHDERIHAVVHEPLAHRRAGERREILVGRSVRGGRADDDGVSHRARLLRERAMERATFDCFCPMRDVDGIERAETWPCLRWPC